jgi:outer membrane protein
MKLARALTIGAALILTCSSAVFAQTAAKPSEPALTAPVLFPVEAKFAFLDFQRIASDSVSGKLAVRILQELRTKKVTEIEAQTKALDAMASRRDAGVLSGAALTQLTKDMDRLQRAIQFSQQNAEAEIQQTQTELRSGFEKQVTPVVEEIAKEKGLLAVFAADTGITFYINPALDISGEVIKRLDAQPKK